MVLAGGVVSDVERAGVSLIVLVEAVASLMFG
jgi:hypothetical protein